MGGGAGRIINKVAFHLKIREKWGENIFDEKVREIHEKLSKSV